MNRKVNKDQRVFRLCIALVFALALLVASSTAGGSLKIKKNQQHRVSKIAVTDNTIISTITSVHPSVFSLATGTNLTITFTGTSSLSCAVCNFNITSVRNVTTNPSVSTYYEVICPFPDDPYTAQGIVSVWVSECNNPTFSTNTYPLYVFKNPPTIESLTPEALYSTGGFNVTVTLSNPLPTFLNLPIYCNLTTESISQPWLAILTGTPGVVICPFPTSPIGPATFSVYWATYNYYPYTVISSAPYQVVIRSNRILSISPTSTCVLGGANITLHMEHPVGPGVYCMFSAVNDEGEFETVDVVEAFAIGTSYICSALPWGESNGVTAAITLVYPNGYYPLTNPVELYYFNDCATSISPTTLCSVSEYPVAIYGQGLPTQSSFYGQYLRAIFWPTPHITGFSQYSGYVYANSSTQATFIPNVALYNHEQYYVQIASTYNFYDNVTSLPLLEVRNTNSCLSSITPSVLNYNGGDLVTVTASSPTFSSTCINSCYFCVFVDPSEIKTFIYATYVSPFEVNCVAPAVTNPGPGTVAIMVAPSNSNLQTDPLPIKWIRP